MLNILFKKKNRKKIYFFNDTSTGHAGSKAVMESLNYQLRQHDVIARHHVHSAEFDKALLEKSDVVFVNGEGTIHHNAPRGNFLMDILSIAQSMGKKTFLVNAVFQQDPPYYTETLKNLDFFSVREPYSFENARRCGADPILLLDSAADTHFRRKNGRQLNKFKNLVKGYCHVNSNYAELLNDSKADRFGLLEEQQKYKFNDIVETLKSVRMYITGQHHAVYAAGFAKTPFIAIPSNSHKIESLINWSNLPIPTYDGSKDIDELVEFSMSNKWIYDQFYEFLNSNSVFSQTHFDKVLNK